MVSVSGQGEPQKCVAVDTGHCPPSPPLPRATGTVKHLPPRVRTSPEEHPPAD